MKAVSASKNHDRSLRRIVCVEVYNDHHKTAGSILMLDEDVLLL